MMKRNICMVTDKNQFDYALSNIMSMGLKSSNNKLEFHLIVDSMMKAYEFKIEKVRSEFKKRGLLSNINIVDASEFEIPKIESKLEHITWVTNLRLFLHDLLPNVTGKILYLDNDLYIDGNINDVFTFINKSDGLHYGRKWSNQNPWINDFFSIIGKEVEHGYCNAGVLVLDIDELRKSFFTEKITSFYNKYGEVMKYADQDVLNGLINFEELPSNFNIGRDNWPEHKTEWNNLLELRIYHFLSYSKPWSPDSYNIEKIKDVNVKGTFNLKTYNKMKVPREKWIIDYNMYIDKIG